MRVWSVIRIKSILLTTEIHARSQGPYSSNAVIPSTTEWNLTVITIEVHADSRSRCDFDIVIPPYVDDQEIAHVATEMMHTHLSARIVLVES
jgi:hypothetical protein